MWNKEIIQLDAHSVIWIKERGDDLNTKLIVIEVRRDHTIAISYPSNVYIVDIDRDDER